MSLKKGFEVVVLDDVQDEEKVQARLDQYPDRLYSEQDLLTMSKSPCIKGSFGDAVFDARLAVIRKKSDLGFLSSVGRFAPKSKAEASALVGTGSDVIERRSNIEPS